MRLIIFMLIAILFASCGKSDAYAEGMHWDYAITCQDGFVYKHLDRNRGTVPVLNSDGSRLKCGDRKY